MVLVRQTEHFAYLSAIPLIKHMVGITLLFDLLLHASLTKAFLIVFWQSKRHNTWYQRPFVLMPAKNTNHKNYNGPKRGAPNFKKFNFSFLPAIYSKRNVSDIALLVHYRSNLL